MELILHELVLWMFQWERAWHNYHSNSKHCQIADCYGFQCGHSSKHNRAIPLSRVQISHNDDLLHLSKV